MAVDPNWARWAFASVVTVMKQLAQQADIPALVEGLDERTTAYMEAPRGSRFACPALLRGS